MDPQQLAQLEKVLALADSSHEGEAAAAVRKARELLSRDGLSFGDLLRAAGQKPRVTFPFGLFGAGPQANLEAEVARLRQKLDAVTPEFEAQAIQLEMWRQRAAELEQKLNVSQAEVRHWRQLARDTVEKLWDLGKAVREDEDVAVFPKAKSA